MRVTSGFVYELSLNYLLRTQLKERNTDKVDSRFDPYGFF